MKSVIKTNRSVVVAGAMATLAVAAMGFAGAAQARDNVSWSVGVGVGVPGAVVNVGNGGAYYPQPVYVQPQPVYVQPAPVYYQPRPVFVRPQPVFVQPQVVYGAPQPVYYGRPHGWRRHHDGYYGRGQDYAPVYYQRDQRGDRRYGRDDD